MFVHLFFIVLMAVAFWVQGNLLVTVFLSSPLPPLLPRGFVARLGRKGKEAKGLLAHLYKSIP